MKSKASLALLTLISTSWSEAAIIISVQQVDDDVVVTGSGFVLLPDTGASSFISGAPDFIDNIDSSPNLFVIGGSEANIVNIYAAVNFTAVSPIKFASKTDAPSGSGDIFGLAPTVEGPSGDLTFGVIVPEPSSLCLITLGFAFAL